jgi:hypothetical protein
VSNVARILNATPQAQLLNYGLSDNPSSAQPLKIHTCSPVRMQITDSSGATDGVDDHGNLLEEITNSSFLRFDDTEGALLDLNPYSVSLKATTAGSFTLVFTRGANPETVQQFTEVPISFNSRATMQFAPNSATLQLQLDIDGDGIPDFSITSGAPVPLLSYFAALQNILSALPLAVDVRTVLADRIRQAQTAFGQEHIPDVRKKLLEFNTDIDKFASKQLLTQSQAALLKELSNKALNAF